MSFLLDTNILVRLANMSDPLRDAAIVAVAQLHRRGEALFIAPQNVIEFWNVATRPASVNGGLGMSVEEVRDLVDYFLSDFQLVAESSAIFPLLKGLLWKVTVAGKQVHDARLVAACHANGIENLLTFNVRHFARFAAIDPGLNVVDPATLGPA